VDFPAPVDEVLDVRFLVDTGATYSTLHRTHLSRLGRRIGSLHLEPLTRPVGLAGGRSVRPNTTDCTLVFPHEGGGFTRFHLKIVVFPEPESMGTPALLGMDVISLGDLTIRRDGAVTFDCPPGAIEVPMMGAQA
jgi:hypothetical protein